MALTPSNMQVQVQRLSPVLLELNVEIEAPRVQQEIDKSYAKVSRTARVRGYRPGKAPRQVIAQVFGPRIAAEVAQRLVDETFPEAVRGNQVQPISSPAFEPQRVLANQPFVYKARFEVLPEIAEVSYEALAAKRPSMAVSDEEVDQELERLRRENATLEPFSEPRGVLSGDVVTIDYSISVGGAVVSDAGAQGFQVELGAGTLLPAIETELLDKHPGDQVEVEIEMPAQHPHPKLRGRKAQFRVELKDAKQRVLPALDDELARDVGEFETLAALREDVRKRLEKAQKEKADNSVAEQLVAELVKNNPLNVPSSLVEQQYRITEQEILQRARATGSNPRSLGDELRQQVRQDSEMKVRAGLLIAEIAKRNSIKIGDAEIEEGIKELAEQSGKNVAKVRAEYREKGKRDMLVGMILENKVLDLIESKAKIEDA